MHGIFGVRTLQCCLSTGYIYPVLLSQQFSGPKAVNHCGLARPPSSLPRCFCLYGSVRVECSAFQDMINSRPMQPSRWGKSKAGWSSRAPVGPWVLPANRHSSFSPSPPVALKYPLFHQCLFWKQILWCYWSVILSPAGTVAVCG